MEEKREQFGLIYDQYIEKIYRFVYLKVSSREIAEDITSRVFMKGWESYKNSNDIKNLSAFLYQIARNLVVDFYRDRDRTKVVASSDDIPHLADTSKSPHEKAVLALDVEMVRSAIQNIKKDYQDVIIWHYLEDMPVSEISVIMQKPEGTVRVMMHRGLEALKKEVKEI